MPSLGLASVYSSAQFVIAKQDRAGQGRRGRAGQKLAKCRTAQCCMVEHDKKHYDTDKREAEGGAGEERVDNKQGEECRKGVRGREDRGYGRLMVGPRAARPPRRAGQGSQCPFCDLSG